MLKRDQVNVAIIGMGRMGMTHFSIINSNDNVNIVAVVDTSSLVLSLIKKYLKYIHIYSDYNDLFQNESLDAVVICTPPNLHYQIALKAAEYNVNVFSEKPFTTHKSEAAELADIFRSKNLINQVGYVNRFNDVFKTTREYIREGVIGNVIRFKSAMYSRTITKTEEGHTWRDSRDNGGGAVFEMASHAIDLLNYIVGKPDKVTGSCLTRIYSKNVEDAVNSTLLYQNGISGTIDVNWSDESFRKPTNKIEVFGSKGKILADQHGLKVYLKRPLESHNLREGWNTKYITDVFTSVPFYVRGNEFTSQLFHFIDCILNREIVNKCTFQDATYTHEIISGIFEDYEKNGKF